MAESTRLIGCRPGWYRRFLTTALRYSPVCRRALRRARFDSQATPSTGPGPADSDSVHVGLRPSPGYWARLALASGVASTSCRWGRR
eukprot:2934821-Heterocapsa_arctica.AAC.1